MRHGLGMMAALVLVLTTGAAISAAEETIEAQAHEYGAVLVRPAGSPEDVKAAKQEYKVHGNAMSMAINHKGVRANVAVKKNGRVLLRNAGNVGSNSVVVGRRFADPVQVASKNKKKKASGDRVVAAE